MTEEKEWVSLAEASRRFGVGHKTMRKLLKETKTDVLHLNKGIRIRSVDLDQLFASRFTTIGELPTNPKGKETI
jgi:hypothetical protein